MSSAKASPDYKKMYFALENTNDKKVHNLYYIYVLQLKNIVTVKFIHKHSLDTFIDYTKLQSSFTVISNFSYY